MIYPEWNFDVATINSVSSYESIPDVLSLSNQGGNLYFKFIS